MHAPPAALVHAKVSGAGGAVRLASAAMTKLRFWAGAAAVACALATSGPVAARSASRSPPTVVELYTAQGCSACPQANALLQELAGRKDVLALTFPVDVWDYLGWADTFAKPEFSARQRAYVARFKLRELYTPEMVVGGRRETLGFDRDKVQALIHAAPALRVGSGPRVRASADGTRVTVGSAAPLRGGGEVWLVRYDPQERTVKVRAGENTGKTLVEQNLVRELVRLGAWSGRARTYRLPAAGAEGLETVILLQGDRGGPVVTAVRL